MEETVVLILLTIVMLIGSYLAGSIPLVVTLSEEKLKVVTVFGAGLLVGTALTVIIPEGIRALYSSDVHVMVSSQSPNGKIPEQIHAGAAAVAAGSSGVAVAGLGADSHHEHDPEHSATIGLSLVLGFIFMMIVDQISSRRNKDPFSSDRNSTATIGLVVHAAADGVALGAAATTSHQDVEMIVFLAIMLHKAPAAFGLVSFLLHEGIDR